MVQSLRVAPRPPDAPSEAGFRTALLFVGALTALRLAVLFSTPMELYPDEAQYWLWSRRLSLGYHSKPPMIAWLIWATTAVGGDAEPWVRLSSPLIQGAAPLVLFQAGRTLYDGRTGLWAAVLYSLMPGVQLSSGVAATDAPLLLCLSLALWAYALLWRAPDGVPGLWPAAGLGLALGLAFLSKYAAVYLLIGLVLHAASDRRARALWGGGRAWVAAVILALTIAPNLAWNAGHGFATVAHTVDDAHLGAAGSDAWRLHPRGMVAFLFAQFGVFGPIPFAVFVGGLATAAVRRRLVGEDRLLVALAAPALALVLVEAALVRANANWAAAAYPPAVVLVSAWLVRRQARWTLWAAVLTQGAVATLFLAAAIDPRLADALGLSNGLKRARGWRAEAALVQAELARAQAGAPVTAVAVDDRFAFNTLAYYGREGWGRPGAPPLRMWVRRSRPGNQAEREAPLTAAEGARVLFVSSVKAYAPEARADFTAIKERRSASVRLDRKHSRELALFVGRDYRRRPRDPATGLPLSAPTPP